MTRSTEGVLAAASSMYLVTLAKLADLSAPAFNCNNATLRDLDNGDFNTGGVMVTREEIVVKLYFYLYLYFEFVIDNQKRIEKDYVIPNKAAKNYEIFIYRIWGSMLFYY